MNNKILILTGKAGQGHIAIARSLEYWAAQWGMEPRVLDILPGYLNTNYKLSVKTHTHKPVFKLTNNRYLSRLLLSGFNGSLEERLATLCPEYKSYDTAISTHPIIHPSFAKINIITVENPSVHKSYFTQPRPTYYLSYWQHDRRYELLGPIARGAFYNELKSKTKQSLKKEMGLAPEKFAVIILAGGEWINKSQDYLDILGYAFDPDKYEFIFICGKNERFKREMENYYKNINFKFLGWLNEEEMNTVLRAGDCGLCFSTGTGVVTETGLCKLPLYIVDTLGAQEEGYPQIVERNGVGRYLKGGYWDKVDRLKEYVPQTQKLFEKNLNKWSDYLMGRPKVWEDFFNKKVLQAPF